MSVFAKKIRNLRDSKNMSTRMLAEELNISASQVSKYENDIHEPTLTVLKAYSRFFSVTLDYLCNDDIE